MGVPRFFWWFVNKYPKTLSDAERAGADFDNLYIDLNDIIHRSFKRPDDLFQPNRYGEILWIVYRHIDRLLHIVKPRKLLFLAIDGVASRAKMYPIRSGRSGVAMSDDVAEWIEEKLRREFEKEGKSLLSEEDTQRLDTCVVTPGTIFMQILSHKLGSYICKRMSEDSAWGNIKVILSDDKVPGEGEHKIMSFIRAQRALPGYDPNTRHCVYGTDTDIIMLALATHELHFSILREEPILGVVELKFLNVCVLREYLALDLKIPCSDKLEYDLERIIDDFIFICFFAGNDFLPRMPSLQTHEGCIDLLMYAYKKEFQNFGGYLVDMQKAEDGTGGCINFKGVERFILAVGAYEDRIFSKRSQLTNRKSRPPLEDSRKALNFVHLYNAYAYIYFPVLILYLKGWAFVIQEDNEKDHQDDGRVSQMLAKYAIVDTVDGVFRNTVELLLKVADEYDLLPDVPETDKVRFGTHGWRERYYKEKFSAETPEDIEVTRKIQVAKYGEGLCWVLLCYFSGVPSWSWYYPYLYAPLASDMEGLSQTKVEFQKGLPFKPFDQLMGVLPPSRAYLLPEAYQRLMIDKNSKIAYLYFKELDEKGGKSHPWRDVEHPSIDEDLLSETQKLENELKTVKEEDRVVNIRWHEVGSNTYQNRRQFKGETYVTTHVDKAVGKLKLEYHTISSLRPNYGNWHHQWSGYYTRSIAGSWRKYGYGGTGSRREPDSSFWPSRIGATYDSNDDWRANKQSAQKQRPNESSSSTSSMGSGRWYYPYRYAPLASDMQGLSQTKVEFQKGLPFKPFDQLVAVRPPSRAHLLPEAYKNSKIAYLYFKELDEGGGNSRPWRDMKHPCIDEDLLSETQKLEIELKDHERIRNSETLAMLFVKRSSEASKQIVGCSGARAVSNKIEGAVMMNSPIEGIQGVLHLMPEDLIDIDDVLCMFYETNQDYQHVSQLLKGVNIPQKTVKEEDRVENSLWHEVGDQNSQGASKLSSDGGKTYAADHTMSSLGPNYGNRHHQSSENNTRSIAGSWRKDGYGGTGSHREPDSSLWPSRSGETYDPNDDWRKNKQSGAAPKERSAQKQRPNESSSSSLGSGRW